MRHRRRLLPLLGAAVLLTAMLAAPMARAVVPLASVLPLPSLPLPSLPLPSVPLPTPPLLPTPLPTLAPLPTLPPIVPTLTPAATPSSSRPTVNPESTESPDGIDAPTPSDDGAGAAAPSPTTTPDQTAEAVSPGSPFVRGDDERPPGALEGLVVPGLTLGVPTLLVIAFVMAQMLGGIALLPALRRTLGSLGLRGGSMAANVPEEPAGGSEASS